MRLPKYRVLAFSLALFLCAPGCATYSIRISGPQGENIEADLAIRELVIRNTLQEYRTPSPVFVSFGDEQPDPPSGFLDRFGEQDVVLLPISSYSEWQQNVYERVRATRDTSLGIRTVLNVDIVEWFGPTRAEVSVLVYRGPLDAVGLRTTVTWKKGKWSMRKALATTTS